MMGRLEERWMGALEQPGTWPEVLRHYLNSRDEEMEGRLLEPPGRGHEKVPTGQITHRPI